MAKTRLIKGIAAAGIALLLPLTACSSGGTGTSTAGTGAGTAATGTLTIWDYEGADSAMSKGWAKAIEIFKTEHPGVTVKSEKQTFEQIQKNAKIVLSGDSVPDVMEYNKGNATAGVLASEGLITSLNDVATKRGWDTKLKGALATTGKYTDKGLMGSGDWYGIPNYGEYVTVFYNKDMFAANGVAVPTTAAEFEAALAAFKAKGITPLAESGAEYPMGQLWYQLVLANANRDFVNGYQLFTSDVDFHGTEMTKATETLDSWVKKGYISKDAAALKAEDMGVSFINGKYPIMVSGSWWFGRLKTEIKFNWGSFLFPGNKLNTGSTGNLWVVPEKAKNKTLAYDFIDITLRPEVQNVIGANGGLPIAGDASTISDPQIKAFTADFSKIVADDGLSFYPDWPVAGYYDVLVSGFQSLVNQSKTPAQVLDFIAAPYAEGKKSIKG